MKKFLYICILALFVYSCSSSDDKPFEPDDPQEETASLEIIISTSIADNGSSSLGINDVINYTINISNSGSININNISLNAILTDGSGNSLSLDSSLDFVSSSLGSTVGSLTPNETATYQCSYSISMIAAASGVISNSIEVSAQTQNGETVNINNNDPFVTNIEADPTIIKEFHLHSFDGSEIIAKYKFDENGRIESTELSELIYNFGFNETEQLTNINVDDVNQDYLNVAITYDENNRITSINDRTFLYNPDLIDFILVENFQFPGHEGQSFYFEDSSFLGTNPDEFGTLGEYIFKLFFESQNGYISEFYNDFWVFTSFDNVVTETFGDKYIWNYNNNALLEDGHSDYSIPYTYLETSNPLYQQQTNLANIIPFLSSHPNQNIIFNTHLISLNNRLRDNTIMNAESGEYLYEYNELNLPISSIRQNYFYDILESETPYGNYYYQGDIIPE